MDKVSLIWFVCSFSKFLFYLIHRNDYLRLAGVISHQTSSEGA